MIINKYTYFIISNRALRAVLEIGYSSIFEHFRAISSSFHGFLLENARLEYCKTARNCSKTARKNSPARNCSNY